MKGSMSVPFVSIIMPVYEEAQFIRRSLGAVLAQDYPVDRFEVLVVDGRSTDQTVPIVQSMADSRVKVLTNPGKIQACAMNIALDAAQGDVIIRVDGHTIIAPDYVSRCVHHLETTGADNVGGPQRFVGITPMGQAIAAAYRAPFGVPSRFTVSRSAEYVDTVYMGAWPREVFARVGGFDETLAGNEDYEFNYRIRQAGGRVYLSPDIYSAYYGRQTLSALSKQFFNYGRWKFDVLVKHPASTRPRHLIAPAFVAVLVGSGLLAPCHRKIAQWWRRILAVYGLANGIASAWQALHEDRALLLRLPVVFACMHIMWGCGFWMGAIRWITSNHS